MNYLYNALQYFVFNILGYAAGFLLYCVSFVTQIPNAPEPTIERVALDKKEISVMELVVPTNHMIGEGGTRKDLGIVDNIL